MWNHYQLKIKYHTPGGIIYGGVDCIHGVMMDSSLSSNAQNARRYII